MKNMKNVVTVGLLSLGLFTTVGNAKAETKKPSYQENYYFSEEYIITEIDKYGNVYGDGLTDDRGLFYTPYKLNVRVGDFVKGTYDVRTMELVTVERVYNPTSIKMISKDYIITHINEKGEIFADSLTDDSGLYLCDEYHYSKGFKVGDYVRGYFNAYDMEYVKADKLIKKKDGSLVPQRIHIQDLIDKLNKKKAMN